MILEYRIRVIVIKNTVIEQQVISISNKQARDHELNNKV